MQRRGAIGGGLLGTMFDYTGRRRGPEDGGLPQVSMPMHGEPIRNDGMQMQEQVPIPQAHTNPPSMTKRGRTPGTKVLKTCPDCQHQIPAALSKCTNCPHMFRERKQKGSRSGKRGKKICPSCQFENPAATSQCKSCGHVFRLKINERFNKRITTTKAPDANVVRRGGVPNARAQVQANREVLSNQHHQATQQRHPGGGMPLDVNPNMGMNMGAYNSGMGNMHHPYGMANANVGMMNNNPGGMGGMAGMSAAGNPAGPHGMQGYHQGMQGMPGIGGIGQLGGMGGMGSLNPGMVMGGARGGPHDHKHDMQANMHHGRQHM